MLQSASIEYKHDGYLCEGFAVWAEAGAKRPGILVFPEWVGVGEYTFKRAQMLGDLGFNAFVVDVYGNPEDGPPPAAYNKQADQRSWIAMQNFFKEIFV